jgi:hypothetical protein
LITLDTVGTDTPAVAAISAIVVACAERRDPLGRTEAMAAV